MSEVVERVTALNGKMVLRHHGRLMASAIDPEGEAEAWQARRSSFVNEVRTLIVLGAGAGYHVHRLQQTTQAALIVVDYSAALISAVKELHNFDSSRVLFVELQQARQLRASVHIRAAVRESFLVMQHAPSLAEHREFYADCQRLLIGRDWESLHWQWKLKDLAPLDVPAQLDDARRDLTIHDLAEMEFVQNTMERERLLIKALRELVK